MDESKRNFNNELFDDDLQVMEKDVMKISISYNECIGKKHVRPNCFLEMLQLLKDSTKDFKWAFHPQLSKWQRIKYGMMYLSYTTMNALIAAVVDNKGRKLKRLSQKYRGHLNRLSTIKFDFHRGVENWRNDQVEPVHLCELHTVFWKKFEGTCETRWKRSFDDDEDDNGGEILLGNSTASEGNSGDDKEDTEISETDESNHFYLENKVSLIGNRYPKKILFRVTVRDLVTKKFVYFNEFDTDESMRGESLQHMFMVAKKKRFDYIDTLKDGINEFNKVTNQVVEDILNIALNIL